jgi:hypothetical protein
VGGSISIEGVAPDVSGPTEISLEAAPFQPLRGLALGPDGQFVVIGGGITEAPVANIARGGVAGVLAEAAQLFRPAFITTSLKDLHEGKWSGGLGVLYPRGLAIRNDALHTYSPAILGISPGGRWVAVSPPLPAIHRKLNSEVVTNGFWDMAASPAAGVVARTADNPVLHAVFSRDGRWMVDGAFNHYWIRKPGDWDVVLDIPIRDNARVWIPAAFSPDSALLAVTVVQREVRLLRTETWEVVTTFPVATGDRLLSLNFTPDGARLVGTSDGAVHIWDVARIRAKWRELGVDIE